MKRALIAGLILAAPTDVAAQECRTFASGEEISRLSDDRIDEASGLAASWQNEGIFWVHNDSGDDARVFAIDTTGATRTVVNLPGVTARDWEDMAIGPCSPGDTTPCIWVGDIGDNNKVWESVLLHRFEEPELLDDSPTEMEASDVQTIEVAYADGPRDAEALLVHPIDGRVFIIDKTPGDPSNMWIVPTDSESATATVAGSASLGEIGIIGGRITGADFAPSGNEFSIRTYTVIYTFCGDDPATAFSGSPSRVIGYNLFQSESLTYARDGQSIWTTSEVRRSEEPPLVKMELTSDPTTMEPGQTDVGPASPDAGAPTDSGSRGVDAEAPDKSPETSDSGSGEPRGCSCSTTQETDYPRAAGLLMLAVIVLVRLRKRLPTA